MPLTNHGRLALATGNALVGKSHDELDNIRRMAWRMIEDYEQSTDQSFRDCLVWTATYLGVVADSANGVWLLKYRGQSFSLRIMGKKYR